MSPAGTSLTGSCSLPRIVVTWCSRSSVTVRPLSSDASVFTVPCSTLNRLTRPTYGSTSVLNTNAAGRRLARGDVRRRTLLDDEAREPVHADEPRSRCPHSTGNTVASSMPVASAVRELLRVDRLVGEVALHEVVVGDDDPFDERVVHRVLDVRELVGHRTLRPFGRRPVVDHRGVGQQVDDAAEVALLADRELEWRDSRPEAVLELFERAVERRALAVELVDEDDAGDAALPRPSSTRPRSAPRRLRPRTRRTRRGPPRAARPRRHRRSPRTRACRRGSPCGRRSRTGRARARPRSVVGPPPDRSHRRCCRPRSARSAASRRRRRAAPRRASSCRSHRGPPARRCGSLPSETSSLATPRWSRPVSGGLASRADGTGDCRQRPPGFNQGHHRVGPRSAGNRKGCVVVCSTVASARCGRGKHLEIGRKGARQACWTSACGPASRKVSPRSARGSSRRGSAPTS